MLNWLFAFPAVYTVVAFGRRNLLLTTSPLMAISFSKVPKDADSENDVEVTYRVP
ncbi:hypothetical protein K474DRAFT_1669711 [Panus rudis PR-1116 ss-1]|nr:hypothetical protein K474DRAFT_1669711 [Panus rudis PR-1116 ss-1]